MTTKQELDDNNLKGYFFSMEKSTPHHDLETVKSLVRDKSVRITTTALHGAHLLGLE